jgi:hypothetical protein
MQRGKKEKRELAIVLKEVATRNEGTPSDKVWPGNLLDMLDLMSMMKCVKVDGKVCMYMPLSVLNEIAHCSIQVLCNAWLQEFIPASIRLHRRE